MRGRKGKGHTEPKRKEGRGQVTAVSPLTSCPRLLGVFSYSGEVKASHSRPDLSQGREKMPRWPFVVRSMGSTAAYASLSRRNPMYFRLDKGARRGPRDRIDGGIESAYPSQWKRERGRAQCGRKR